MKRRIYLALFDLFDRVGWERARLWAIGRAGALTDWGEGERCGEGVPF